MLVFVKGVNGQNLMPCKPAKARKLLRDGRAKVIKRMLFTIQLLFECENQTQPITLGIDKGAKVTGFACVGNGKLLLSGEIQHRQDVKKKMTARRANRHARRGRLWYRKPRFDNRASSRRKGRIPPSVRTNVEEVVRIANRIPLPICKIVIEDAQIDIAKLNNPSLRGKQYQVSNRLDENLRLATLIRDNFQCQICKKKKVKLHAHHIIFRENGGKDSILNLITLCLKCHKKVHQGVLKITDGVSGFKDRMAQQTMQGKTWMYENLKELAPIEKVFGYQTSGYRKMLNLPKNHDVDALCVATLKDGEVVDWSRDNYYKINFYPKQTRRQYLDLPRKGKGRVRYQVNEDLCGFMKGDIVEVKGFLKRVNSIYSNGTLAFARVKDEPGSVAPKRCKLIEKGKTILWKKAA